MLRLNRRLSPKTSPIPSPMIHTDELPTPMPTAALPQSFGHDFNLIRAVEEYGPQRVASIRQELAQMAVRQSVLTKEMETLERLISVTKPSGVTDRDMAYAMAEGHPDAYTTFTERMQKTHNGIASQDIAWATSATYTADAAARFGNGFEMD